MSNNAILLKRLNDYAYRCYDANAATGWSVAPSGVGFGTSVAIVHSQISEMLEGFRKDAMDTHLPHRKNMEVELAAIAIRVLSLCLSLRIDNTDTLSAHYFPEGIILRNMNAPPTEVFMLTVSYLHSVVTEWRTRARAPEGYAYDYERVKASQYIFRPLIMLADKYEFNILATIDEKLAFNATRADHQKTARERAGGKKF